MKIHSTPLSLLVGIVFLTLAAVTPVRASAEDQVNQALAVSKTWVGQIDAGKYEDSYAFACDETRNRFPEDRWVSVLKALRKPWGAVVNRQQMSHIYKPHGVPGLEGECVVVTYSTKFKNMDPATEVVVLKWEDGKWQGAGYNAGPPPSDASSTSIAPAFNGTETHTEAHVRPQGQQ